MLAMLRKHGDTTLQTPSANKRKTKPLKVMKGRSRGGEERKPDAVAEVTVTVPVNVKVRDDEDGHLVYRKGDLLESRCTYLNILFL